MKLLVGGDSFAQFPNGEWYLTKPHGPLTVEYPESNKGGPITVTYDYKHTGQLLDENAVSVGMGGGDLSATTFVTLQELEKQQDFTHVLFYITNFNRDIIDVSQRNDLKVLDAISGSDHTMPSDFYKTEVLGSSISREHDDESNYRFLGHWWYASNEEIQAPMIPEIKIYNRMKSEFTYFHNGLSNLALLKTYCDDRNINLLCIAPMHHVPNMKEIESFLNIDIIVPSGLMENYWDYLKSPLFKWSRSHYSSKQHKTLADHIIQNYPEWISMHDK